MHFIILDDFSRCLNIDKTKAKHLEKPLKSDHYTHGLSWIKIPLEILGIFITNYPEENLKYNFRPN